MWSKGGDMRDVNFSVLFSRSIPLKIHTLGDKFPRVWTSCFSASVRLVLWKRGREREREIDRGLLQNSITRGECSDWRLLWLQQDEGNQFSLKPLYCLQIMRTKNIVLSNDGQGNVVTPTEIINTKHTCAWSVKEQESPIPYHMKDRSLLLW